MNTINNYNYQTSFGMRQGLKSSEIIQRKAKSVYPHISPYVHCDRYIGNDKLHNFIMNLQKKLSLFRGEILTNTGAPHKTLAESLKNGLRLGNSGEEVELASMIGRINGQKNIFSASIDGLDHGVCFITDKAVTEGKSQVLKDKEAIIIDPQLGITDYAENYIVKLKELMGKNYFKNKELSVKPHKNQLDDESVIQYFKENYPELVIKDYKQAQL